MTVGALVKRYGKGTDSDASDALIVADTLTSGSHPASNMPGRRREDDTNLVTAFDTYNQSVGEQVQTLRGTFGDALPAAQTPQGVRRLTPVECERLQGFPDDWTAIDGPATPDSRRYAACGNAVTVNVAEWIGHRLAMHIGEPSPTLAPVGNVS